MAQDINMLQAGQDTADDAGSLSWHLLIRGTPARAAAALRLSSCSMLQLKCSHPCCMSEETADKRQVSCPSNPCWVNLEIPQRGQRSCSEAQLSLNVAQHAVIHLGIPQELPLYAGEHALQPLQALRVVQNGLQPGSLYHVNHHTSYKLPIVTQKCQYPKTGIKGRWEVLHVPTLHR